MTDDLKQLKDHIRTITKGRKVVVALSGGVDSTLVAVAARDVLGDQVRFMTVDSEFIARSDMERVVKLAEELNISLETLTVSLLGDANIRINGQDRCYRCKKKIMTAIKEKGGQDVLILDGTNAGDDPDRPGRRALREAEAASPLSDIGMVKESIRVLAKEMGLPNADLPSNSCLATRVSNQGITREYLDRIEELEDHLHGLGFTGIRARLDDLKVIVEIPRGSEGMLEQSHERIREKIEEMGLSLAGYGLRDVS